MHATVADPRVQQIPVTDCGEPLIQLSIGAPDLRLDHTETNLAHLGYTPDFRLREAVVRRIAQVQTRLDGQYNLLIKECYRPLAIQTLYFDRYLSRLRTAHPELDETTLYHEAAKYVAPPEYATHVTGAALDLTLLNHKGIELDLGTVYDASPGASNNACYTAAQNISREAQLHRAVLTAALEAEGFINYPYEWWHWSYGDKYWAYGSHAEQAVYGPVSA